MPTLEFGLDTFLPITVDQDGLPIGGDQVIRNAVEEAVLAEAVGIDSFNIGEHYRTEFMDSASHVVLAAIASRTERIRQGRIPTWVGVGGSPQSVVRAARFGLPLMLAVIAGRPERFAPYVELYKQALQQHGQPQLPIGLHTLGFVADTDDQALEIQWPYYKEQFEWAARERGWRPPTYDQFLAEVDHGSLYVGSPETVANRIATTMQTLSLSRFDLLYALGRVPHDLRLASIELYGREVIPRVRELLAAVRETEDARAAVRS